MNMITFLDLLVIVFMVLASLGLLALCMMFLVRNPRVKKISFYITIALAIYAASIGIRIGYPLFIMQAGMGVLLGVVSIAALVMERKFKNDEKKLMIARVMAAVALVAGIINAFV